MSDNGRLSPARWEESLHCQMGGRSALCNHIMLFHLPTALHCNCIATALRAVSTRESWSDARCVDAGDQSLPTYIVQSINCHGNDLVRWFHKFHRNHCMPRCTHKLYQCTPYHHKHNCAGTIANSVQLELWLCPLLCPLWQVNMFCNKVWKAQELHEQCKIWWEM